MTSDRVESRIVHLLDKAAESAGNGNLHEASVALREASHLDAHDVRVKHAIVALQHRDQTGDALHLVRSYLGTGPAGDGERALRVLRQKELPVDEAQQILGLLLHTKRQKDLLDSLTGALLSRSTYARKEIAARFEKPITELFTQLWERGEDGLNAFASIPLDESLWSSRGAQNAAQRDLFRLCIAKIIDVDIEKPERLMKVVARQLATAPDHVSGLIDADIFAVVLGCLDIRLTAALRSQAILATSKILEVTKERGEALFGQFLAKEVAKQTNDDLIVAFSAASAIFPIVPAVAAALFMTDGFVQQLVPNLEKNSEAATLGQRKSRTLEQSALELLSAACVDKACREAIDRYCSPWLRDLSEERDGKHKALAALILAKIGSESQEDITVKLADLVLVGDGEREQAVEGLAYTSLQPKVKEDIVSNDSLLRRLVGALTDRPSAGFGCLTIFLNLTAYRPVQTAEQKKMAQLQAYANSQKPTSEDALDNDSQVTLRAKKLLDVDIIPALVASSKQTSSPTNIAMVVRILLSLSREQKHRSKMAQQGAVKLLVQIRERLAKTDKSTADASTTERNASHAIARLLVSVNPAHTFSGTLSTTSAVSALVPLLSLDQGGEQRDLLPTFESLLALTNLASLDDNSVRDLIIRSAFDTLEDLLFSSNARVQRAGVELVCNLMASPSGVAKFADGSHAAKRRMRILLALADVDDIGTRKGAGGGLAMLTEWDTAVSAILDQERGVSVLLSMCEDDSDEMKHRGFACLLGLVCAPGEIGERAMQAVKSADGMEIVQGALRKSQSQEVLSLGVEVLKKLQ